MAVWYGWTDYYAGQFAVTPWYLWPLVSDSPNAVLLFALSMILRQLRRGNHVLDLIAFMANIKVGLWTVFVLLYYYDEFFATESTLRWILFVLHAGMVAQAFALYRGLAATPSRTTTLVVVGAAFAGHDLVDYGLGTHPFLPERPDSIVIGVTVGLTALATAVAYFLLFSPKAAGRASSAGPLSPASETEQVDRGTIEE